MTAAALLRNADLAMYQAKSSGKNRCEQFRAELHVQNLAPPRPRRRPAPGARRPRLTVHYQPVVDLADGRIDGVEALLRWNHPTLGFVPPPTFVRAAEEAGLIGRLGHFVAGPGVPTTPRWSERLGRPLTLGVNMSGQQLRDDAVLHQVRGALTRDGMAPAAGPRDHRERAGRRRRTTARDPARAARARRVGSRSTTSARATRRSATCGGCPSTS